MSTSVSACRMRAKQHIGYSLAMLSNVPTRYGSRLSVSKTSAYQKIERIYTHLEYENAKNAHSALVDARTDLYTALTTTNNYEACRMLAMTLVEVDWIYRALMDMSVALFERDGADEATQF